MSFIHLWISYFFMLVRTTHRAQCTPHTHNTYITCCLVLSPCSPFYCWCTAAVWGAMFVSMNNHCQEKRCCYMYTLLNPATPFRPLWLPRFFFMPPATPTKPILFHFIWLPFSPTAWPPSLFLSLSISGALSLQSCLPFTRLFVIFFICSIFFVPFSTILLSIFFSLSLFFAPLPQKW